MIDATLKNNPDFIKIVNDEKKLMKLEAKVISEICENDDFLKKLFEDSDSKASTISQRGSISLLHKYLKDPLFYGLCNDRISGSMTLCTITPIPAIDENERYFKDGMPKTGLYQDQHGIGLIKRLALAKPIVNFNPIMVFECAYLPMFKTDAMPESIIYLCRNFVSEDSWHMSWENRQDDDFVSERGNGVLFQNPGYIIMREAQKMYDKNIRKIDSTNLDEKVVREKNGSRN